MACGFGVCLGCAVPRADGTIALVCRDGPVFEAGQVDVGGRAVSADVDTRVDLGGIALRNPVLTASGTFGYGTEFAPFFDLTRIGGIVAKSLTLEPRQGNQPAAHRRDAGRHAERDRPRERRRRRLHRREAASARRGRRRRRERVRDRDRTLRRGLQAPHRRPAHRGHRDQRVVPAREERRDRVRPARRGARGTRARHAAVRRRCRCS